MTDTLRCKEPVEQQERALVFVDGRPDPTFTRRVALGALKGVIAVLRGELAARRGLRVVEAEAPERDVMTADEVAAFLGVDRNTVYDYAGRGVIPHQRLGKRILFGRRALVSWLDSSCKATSTRKG
jgi:excisionase family DNA binding protein